MHLVVVGKLLLSAVLGLMIGIERELKQKPLGLKTCVIIAVSSCLLTIVSIEAATTHYAGRPANAQTDPMRLAAQIVSGIGFLGAGAILRRNNDIVKGLTTAAIIWAASGVGIATGAGFFFEAALGAVFLLFTALLLPYGLRLIGLKRLLAKELAVKVLLERFDCLSSLTGAIKEKRMDVKLTAMKDTEEGKVHADLKIIVFERMNTDDIYRFVKGNDGVVSVEIEN